MFATIASDPKLAYGFTVLTIGFILPLAIAAVVFAIDALVHND